MTLRDGALWIELLLIGAIFGGAVYQRTSLIPEWGGALPDSVIRYFRGTTAAAAISRFWKTVLPPATLMMIVAVAVNWSIADRRLWIGIAGSLYLVNIVATIVYFFPRGVTPLMLRAGEGMTGDEITRMAKAWIFWDWVRFVGLIAIFFCLLRALKS